VCAGQSGSGGLYALGGRNPATVGAHPDPPTGDTTFGVLLIFADALGSVAHGVGLDPALTLGVATLLLVAAVPRRARLLRTGR